MSALESLPIADLKTFASWRDAPVGAILQVCSQNGVSLIGLRCEKKIMNVPQAFVLALDGNENDRGRLLEGNILLEPALDVSSIFEIQVKNPSPTPYTQAMFGIFGIVCEAGLGSGLIFVRAGTVGGLRGYVWLSDPVQGATPGTIIDDLPPDLHVLGFTGVGDKILRVT